MTSTFSKESTNSRRHWEGSWRWVGFCLILLLGSVVLLLSPYVAGILVQSYIFAILAMTTDIAWGYTGILTFASAAMFGIGAYAVGIMVVHISTQWWAMPTALIAGILFASFLSAIIGWLAFYSRIRVSDFYISVVTLGLSLLFSQAALYGGALTGGSNGLSGFPSFPISNHTWYVIAGVVLIGFILTALRFVHSDFGLILRALRDQEVRCRYLGINSPFIKTLVFTATNSVAAVAGVLYAFYSTVVVPSLVGFVLATNVLIWVTLGGRGTIIGPVLAAILVNAVSPELNAIIPMYWQGTLGLLFIVVVVSLPKGLLPGVWRITGRILTQIWILVWNDTGPDDMQSKTEASLVLVSTEPKQPRYVAHYDSKSFHMPGIAPRPSSEKVTDPNGRDEIVLTIHGVSKRYGSFRALSDVSFEVRRGELVSIVGPNGAGKTSLVRCISDGIERTAGSVAVQGQSIGRRPPDFVVQLGVGRKFQGASVFDSLTVGECLRIASWKGRTPSMWNRESNVSLPAASVEVVERMGLHHIWNQQANGISHGQRQNLELAMVLALEPAVLLLDEPTAGLTPTDRSAIGNLLTRLVSSQELAIVLIEHDFEFVKEISTRMVVLHEGRILIDGSVAEVAESSIVKDVYLGRSKR